MDPANIKTIQDMMGQFLAGMEESKKLNPGSSDPANKPLTCLQEAFSLFQSMVMKELAQVKQRMDSMEDRQDRAEQYSRRNCLLFIGLEEGSRDDESACLDLVMDVIKNKLSLELSDHVVERCHRLGPKKQGRRRPIIVKFYSYRYRREVFSAKKSLAGTGVVITEFLTQNRMVVYSKAKEIHGPKNVWTSDGKIMIKVNDRKIVVSSVQQIPGPNPVASQTVNTDRSRSKKTTGTVSDSKTPKKPITRSNSKVNT